MGEWIDFVSSLGFVLPHACPTCLSAENRQEHENAVLRSIALRNVSEKQKDVQWKSCFSERLTTSALDQSRMPTDIGYATGRLNITTGATSF